MKIDWDKVDWDKVGKEKALFLFREAKEHEQETVCAINDLNRKAFNLLALTLPLLIALGSALFSQWGVLESVLRWTGSVMVSGLLVSATFLLFAVWPRKVAYAAGSPKSYFAKDFYANSMLDILHGSLVSSDRRLDLNGRVLAYRGRFFTLGVTVLLGSAPATALVFIAFSV